jgi:hypothetical protein
MRGGRGGGVAGSQPMSTQLCTWSLNKLFKDLTPYLTNGQSPYAEYMLYKELLVLSQREMIKFLNIYSGPTAKNNPTV